MPKRIRVLSLVPAAIVFLLARPPDVRAQAATGRIEGTILTPDSRPASEVRVTATVLDLQLSREVETDGHGYFRLGSLPLGTYEVRLVLVGYRPVKIDSVSVRLDRTTSLGRTTLTAQALELGEIVVIAARPLVDVGSAASGTIFTASQLNRLPTQRNFRSIVRLAPQAGTSYYPGDEADIAGGTGPENAYFLDGVNITDPKLGASSSNLPYNFIRELQVKTGGYEAEYGRATGGIIDVITHSGGNQFGGQLFGHFTDRGLTGSPRFAAEGEREAGFSEYDIGASLGGPILRDRLWFFVAYNPSAHRQSVTVRGPTLPDDYLIQQLFATKLTWQAGPGTDVVVTAHGDPSHHREFPLAGVYDSMVNSDAVTQETHEGGFVLSSLVRHRLGNGAQLEVGASRFSSDNSSSAASVVGRTVPRYVDYTTGEAVVSGGYANSSRDNVSRASVRTSLLAVVGRHTLKLGAEYEDNDLDERNDRSGRPGSPQGTVRRLDDSTWTWSHSEGGGRFRNRIPTAYAQDSWRIGGRLTVNAGLRWDSQYLANGGRQVQSFTNEWQPRVGVIYQLGALGTQKLSASAGRFYEQIPMDFMTAYDIEFGFEDSVRYSHDPRLDPSGGDSIHVCCTLEAPPRQHLRGQYYDEFAVGYQRAIGREFRVGVEGMYRTIRSVVEDVFDPVIGGPLVGNPGEGRLVSAPHPSRTYTALVLTFEKPDGPVNFLASYVLSRTRGNYDGLYSFDNQGAFPNDGASFDTPAAFPRSTGLLPSDHRNAVKLSGSYTMPAGLSTGVALAWTTGQPLSEYGLTADGYYFLTQRGSSGRTPSVLDVSLQLAYAPPHWGGAKVRPTFYLDLFSIGNQRSVITFDQLHYLGVDPSGRPVSPNETYGRPTLFQPPMSARLGMSFDFGTLD